MSEYQGDPVAPPWPSQLWPMVIARLETAAIQRLLGGPGRVRRVADAIAQPEGREDEAWGRIVIVPVVSPFGTTAGGPGREVLTAFLVRAEVNSPGDPAFDPGLLLDAIHAEVLATLQGWVPPATTHCRFRFPMYQETVPQTSPMWDDSTGLWYTSSQYRVLVSPAPKEEP